MDSKGRKWEGGRVLPTWSGEVRDRVEKFRRRRIEKMAFVEGIVEWRA